MLLANETLYEALDEAGLPPVEIVPAADSVLDFIHGFTIAEGVQAPGRSFNRQELVDRLRAGAAAGRTVTGRVFGSLASDEARYDFDRGFEAGLGLLLKGIEPAPSTQAAREEVRPSGASLRHVVWSNVGVVLNIRAGPYVNR